MEMEKVEEFSNILKVFLKQSFLEEKEQKDEQNDKYREKLKYYKTSIEELVLKLDEYEGKLQETNKKLQISQKENEEIKEELRLLMMENRSNLAKLEIYKRISNKLRVSFLEKTKEICLKVKKDQQLLGKWINENLYKISIFLNDSIKEIMKMFGKSKKKYKNIKENLERKIQKLQENLSMIASKFENVKGNFDREFDIKTKESQKLSEINFELEKNHEKLLKETDFLKRIIGEKEKELDRQSIEKNQLMNEIYEIELKYKKTYSGLEEQMEKNQYLMKEISSLNELLLKKNINENIKAEIFKKMQKITKKFQDLIVFHIFFQKHCFENLVFFIYILLTKNLFKTK